MEHEPKPVRVEGKGIAGHTRRVAIYCKACALGDAACTTGAARALAAGGLSVLRLSVPVRCRQDNAARAGNC